MTKRLSSIFFLIVLLSVTSAAQTAIIPSPKSVLGFTPGDDRTIAGWSQITDYFERLDRASDRVLVQTLGMCPTLAIFGTNDPWTPADDIAALRDAWANRSDCEIMLVEGAEHGFVHDPDRPVHRPDDAAIAWDKTLRWLLP